MKLDGSATESQAIEKIGSVHFFEKLFEVDKSEDILGVMEKLFLYYINSKNTLEYVRTQLKIESRLSGADLFEEIKKRL